MRPRTLDELVGQDHLLAPGSPLRRLVEDSSPPSSVILWGPPGTGKTTIAYLVARTSGRTFVEVSAVSAGVKEVREIIEQAKRQLVLTGAQTVLFVDEVHRFSKAQQDVLLPAVENRIVILVAATTENPHFSVISPLLSRSLLLTLKPIEPDALRELLRRAVEDERGLGGTVSLDEEAENHIVRLAGADARKALTILEAAADSVLDRAAADGPALVAGEGATDGDRATDDERGTEGERATEGEGDVVGEDGDHEPREDAAETGDDVPVAHPHGDSGAPPRIRVGDVEGAVDVAAVRYDRTGDQHYDVTSAFIKSMRGSDVDAALHYLARMVVAGEDPRFIARRIMIAAAEEVAMADPSALQTAVAAAQAVAMIGMPEARLILAEAVVHVATAPKSNATYTAIDAAIADVRKGKAGPVPLHLRDAHYSGAEKLGHGTEYRYAHNAPHAVAAQQYLPDELVGTTYYVPTDRGFERNITERLTRIRGILRGEGE
ncbi:MAG TPA: replication-associated recombination protein A [Actinomycetales bacterium]|nr:replication-associated recombination protein A [Actinomycetales bacterium]